MGWEDYKAGTLNSYWSSGGSRSLPEQPSRRLPSRWPRFGQSRPCSTIVSPSETVHTAADAVMQAHCELQRYRQLKRRDRTFKRALEHLERRKTLELPPADQVLVAAADGDLMPSKEAETAVREIVGNGTGLKREVDEELFEIVKSRFASMRIGGRYQNPFFEWHEEGAWEWCVNEPFWLLQS